MIKYAKVKGDWVWAGRIGRVLGPNVFVGQRWTPILWDDNEDPSWFKTAGLTFYVIEDHQSEPQANGIA